jgi:imidazolonepropionase-like amidohydrolase
MTDILAADVEPSQKTPTQLYQNVKSMYQKPYSTVVRMTQELHKNGAQLLFGSDTPSGPFYSQFPGINGRWEMDRWLEAGISLPELFSALTMRNAIALGLAQTIGSVEVGKQADLLILSANPLLDVKAYDTIEYVILRGKVHQRSSLSARNSAR